MRIISLSAAATEWVVAFGAEGELVGRSHGNHHPASVLPLPVVTDPATGAVDEAVVRALRPDVVIHEEGEPLPAWPASPVHAPQPTLLALGGDTLKQVLDAALRLARGLDRMPAGLDVLGGGERRLAQLRAALGLERRTAAAGLPSLGVVTGEGALRPSRRRLQDQVELAGGRLVAGGAGEDLGFSWAALLAANPEVLCVLPATPGLAAARELVGALDRHSEWARLRAVAAGRVYLLDGAYFHRPGPRLYRGIELLAAALHPEAARAAGVVPGADEGAPLG